MARQVRVLKGWEMRKFLSAWLLQSAGERFVMRDENDPKVFVLKRELSEVHLLLDNISANPETKLPATQAEVPVALGPDWLKKVCEIDWPPHAADDRAEEACLLIRTKDFLNTLAKPASGSTIAFTILVTQQSNSRGGAAPSRTDLAQSAYPDLLKKARSFRKFLKGLCYVLLVWLLLTCMLSWTVAYENLNVQQLLIAQTAHVKATEQVEGIEIPETDSAATPQNTKTQAEPLGLKSFRTASEICAPAERPKREMPSHLASVTQLRACEAWKTTGTNLEYAQRTVPTWLGIESSDDDYLAAANNRLSVLGTGVLPFLFGVLGAGAAIVRSLMRKMKASSLAPRDMNLSLQQLEHRAFNRMHSRHP